MTYFLPTTGPPTPRVLNKQMARTHLRRPVSIQKVLLCTRQRGDFVLGKAGWGLQHGLFGVHIEEVWNPARAGDADFPS